MKFRGGYASPSGKRAPYRATLAAVSENSCFNRYGANSNPIRKESNTLKINLCRASGMLAVIFLATALTVAGEGRRSVFVLTSTNASPNQVVVFELNTGPPASLSWVDMLPTGGNGGASGNAGILQVRDDLGAVANWGSNSVSQLVRHDDFISIGPTINLAPSCVKPDSVALNKDHLYVVGTNCAESHAWPSGNVDGTVVSLPNTSAAQIAVGWSWAAVTLKGTTSGSVLQLWLTHWGALNGTSTALTTLTSVDNNTPFGEAFWRDILGFTPAHSTDTFAIVDKNGNAYPISGLSFSDGQAPCWVAKGPGNAWYTGNSPAHAISIFFSDSQGGAYYKSISLPGPPSDITVSRDLKWLAVIYTDVAYGYVAVYSIDAYGDLTYVATSPSISLPTTISGVAFSE